MLRASLLFVLAVCMLTSVLSISASAAGPFDLFGSGLSCCDSPDCDSCCDSRAYDPCSYCSLFGGWTTLNDYSGETEAPAPPQQLRGSFNDGWVIGGVKGRRFHDGIRGELELAFRSNTADQWSVNGAVGDWSGHLFIYSAMANLYKDWDNCVLDSLGLTPYVGAGIGLAIVNSDFQTSAATIDIDDAAFAYQFMVGGSKKLNRDAELFSEYRFFGTSGLDLANGCISRFVNLGCDSIVPHSGRRLRELA